MDTLIQGGISFKTLFIFIFQVGVHINILTNITHNQDGLVQAVKTFNLVTFLSGIMFKFSWV
jgi:hypothetical protein